MENFQWLAPLKEAVLLLFFTSFTVMAWWTCNREPESIEEAARLPLEEEA
ncbi:MAG: hypothetical protein AB1758_19130 [Candidatus Eremiobacterota bacterium]